MLCKIKKKSSLQSSQIKISIPVKGDKRKLDELMDTIPNLEEGAVTTVFTLPGKVDNINSRCIIVYKKRLIGEW